jgi:serine phosphatase RsbU (regulator of sigma subunit)
MAPAGRAGATKERAAPADARGEMAGTLHRSLLAGHPTETERLDVIARYLPAVGSPTGGDWYDVVPLEDGDIAVAVGDVAGHGAIAAAVMDRLCTPLAALLLAGHPPAQALELLDRFAGHVDGAQLSTAMCVRLSPASGRIAFSRAGHPPPLLIRDEGSAFLDVGLAPALGLNIPRRRPVALATLSPGATLLLYTDGLVERRPLPPDHCLSRLVAAGAQLHSAPLRELVDGVLDRMLAGGEPHDDIAVVAIRLSSQPGSAGPPLPPGSAEPPMSTP